MAARLFPVKSLGTSVVGLLLSAYSAHSAPAPAPPARVVVSPSSEHVLFQSNFREYSPYWRQVRGHWGISRGQLLQTREDPRELNTVMFYDPLIIADADITADAMMVTDAPRFQTSDDAEWVRTKRMIAGAGIAFRYQDENNFYLFRLAGEDGVVLGKVVDGTWYELANPRAADFAGGRLSTEVSYRLRVRVVGNRIQCWIGDRAVANLEDDSLTTGHVGLTTFRSKAVFTSLRIVER